MGPSPSIPTCFRNGYAQLVHRYADFLLLILIGVLGGWMANMNNRVATVSHEQARSAPIIEAVTTLRAEITTLRIQAGGFDAINATLKRHEDILRRLEDRLNVLLDRGGPKSGVPF